MSHRVCKFYARGTCLKGEQCDFVHERKDSPSNICSFFQKGSCAYGSRCRYKHPKASQAPSSVLSSENGHRHLASDSAVAHTTKGTSSWIPKTTKLCSPDKGTRNSQCKNRISVGNGDVGESSTRGAIPSNQLFCQFAAATCPRGDKCLLVHGNQCLYCRKHCLHPTDQKEKENHLRTCEKKEKYLQALKFSQEIECNICLDRVLSKPTLAECKFGVLPECNHAFCLSCIRNWRNSAPISEFELSNDDNPVKTCPVCRKLSYFFIPSDVWYSTNEEKQEIIDNYKAKCRLIDCKHFNSGNGHCPFGISCFYKHTVKPGSYTWIHNRPPSQRRPNNYDMYDVLDMLSEVDLSSVELYSIMRDSECFDDMDPFEMMAISDAMGSGDGPCLGPFDSVDEVDMDFFGMGTLSEALASGMDDFGPEDFYNGEIDPMDAALLSMMMDSNIEEIDDFGAEDFYNREIDPMDAALLSMMMDSNIEEEEEEDSDEDY